MAENRCFPPLKKGTNTMLRVMGKEYPEQLEFKTGELKIAKVRWTFFVLLVLSLVASFATLTVISFGTFIYIYPAFAAIQIIGAVISLNRFRDRYLQDKNIRVLGFDKNGEFLGSVFEKRIYLYVLELSYKAKLKKPPMFAIQETPIVNAYAMGASRNKALIVVNSATIQYFSEESVLALVAHEFGHVVSNDMRNQTFLNCFLYVSSMILTFPKKILMWPIAVLIEDYFNIRNVSYVIQFLAGFLIDIIAMGIVKLIILSYSRRREFRADYAAAKIMGKEKALKMLREFSSIEMPKNNTEHATMAFIGNYSFLDIFSTHPNWKRRIKYIERKMK
ncbi:M48 family metalloprotease [Cohnella hongkongensis]|uniref:M48 family metalloprotease n=1 Tax=Cohnella hongkongensis TaxID=178337 RepID=A0ABV9F9Z7_9BACL